MSPVCASVSALVRVRSRRVRRAPARIVVPTRAGGHGRHDERGGGHGVATRAGQDEVLRARRRAVGHGRGQRESRRGASGKLDGREVAEAERGHPVEVAAVDVEHDVSGALADLRPGHVPDRDGRGLADDAADVQRQGLAVGARAKLRLEDRETQTERGGLGDSEGERPLLARDGGRRRLEPGRIRDERQRDRTRDAGAAGDEDVDRARLEHVHVERRRVELKREGTVVGDGRGRGRGGVGRARTSARGEEEEERESGARHGERPFSAAGWARSRPCGRRRWARRDRQSPVHQSARSRSGVGGRS